MSAVVRVAVAQIDVGFDKVENLAALERCAAAAALTHVRLLVFPEASMSAFGSNDHPLAPSAEGLDGPFVRTVLRLAREHSMFVIAGMFETIASDPARVHNTLILADDSGALVGTYRKMHLYDAFGYRESGRVVAGDGSTLSFTVDGLRFAAMTCYDLRFPELARALAVDGADALVLPAAWLAGTLKEQHLATLAAARAIENTVYVALADQCGRGYCANSTIIDPLGVSIANAGEAENVVWADLRSDRIAAVRAANPSLANRRL